MPYRRLPNTDCARLKAMYTAQQKGKELPPFKLAFSQNAFNKLQSLLPSYEHALSEYKNSYNLQLEKNKDYNQHFRKAKLYLCHFIQVMNMAISRGDLPASTRNYFDMPADLRKNPTLSNEEDVVCWGKKIINGEKQRKMENKTTIANPSVALVKVHFDRFYELYGYQHGLKKRTVRAQEDLRNKRTLSDQLIQQIWNEVENTFKDLPDELKREKATDYGIVYFYRKNELKNINMYESVRIGIS